MAEQMVHNRDFLTDAPTGPEFDVITGNPPYMRWLNLSQILRDEYTAHVPVHATSDLLHSFLDRCARTLWPGGQIRLVTADRWLFAAGAGALRKQVGQNLRIQHMERLDAKTAFSRPQATRGQDAKNSSCRVGSRTGREGR
ncbi:MAG TPA: Eco57I restriction-modification methylase domain-containing protein [Noviherbaspirillum sp.]